MPRSIRIMTKLEITQLALRASLSCDPHNKLVRSRLQGVNRAIDRFLNPKRVR